MLLVLVACGQPPGDTPSTTTDTGQATVDESGTTASIGTTTTDGSSGGSTDDASGTTTGGVTIDDPCLAFPSDACPAPDCMSVSTYPEWPEHCDLDLGDELELCVTAGAQLDPETITTFYAEIDGEIRYIQGRQDCVASMPIAPALWTECSGAPDAPGACACLCGSDGCPYEADLLALEACGLPSPCGDVVPNETQEPTDYDVCVLTALRDRTPGAYGSLITTGFAFDESRVFFGGGDEAQLVHRHVDDLCIGALDGTWERTRLCTLQPPAYFDACLTDPTMLPLCLLGESWFSACELQPASCP